jgi:Helix-turn-helix domain
MNKTLPFKFLQRNAKPYRSWWGYVWRGLVVSKNAKHYKLIGRALWLYLYLIIHADRKTGTLYRLTKTISADMGISKRTIQAWLAVLRNSGYIKTWRTGRSLQITITKWRLIRRQQKD